MQPIIRAHWPRIALGVTLCSLMTVGAVAWPRLHAVLLLRQMRFAMQNAQTAHIVTWQMWSDDCTRHKQIEAFYNNGQWHIEKSYGNWIHELHESLRAPDHSTAVEEVFRPPNFNPMKMPSVIALPEELMFVGLQSRVATGNKTIIQGKSCTVYIWTMDNLPRESQDITLEDKTGLPVESVWRHQDENDVWQTTAIVEYEFNVSSAQFPTGMSLSPPRREGIGATRDEWENRLQTPRAYMQRGKTIIAIRDLRVNSDGDVFVLYTAGHKPGWYPEWDITATDDQGNTYLYSMRSPFHPTIMEHNRVKGFTFNGEALDAAHLTPLYPLKDTGTAWKPRHLTIALYPRNADAALAYVNDGKRDKYMPLKFTLFVEQADTRRVPGYMPYMAMSPCGLYPEYGLQSEAAWTRACYWRNVKHDLAQALTWFQRMESIDNAESRLHHWQINNVFDLLEEAKLQTLLGRHAEARQTLRRADARRAYADAASVRELDAALRKESGAKSLSQ